MILFADIVVKVSLLVGAALAVMPLLRGRSAALRHWVLAVALVCAVAMPLLTIVAPAWHIPVSTFTIGSIAPRPATVSVTIASRQSPARGFDQTADTPRMADDAGRGMNLRVLVGLVWAVGASASAAVLFVGFARLRRIARRAEPLETGRWAELTGELARASGVHRRVTLLRSDHPTLLVTWGVMRPRIVLPFVARDWTDDRARIVLRHELAHVRRGDWAVQIAAEIARSLNWFNPVVWLACRQLRRESERACDDAVLNGGVAPADYASHLVDLARALSAHRRPYVPASAMARSSGLEGRIAAMLNARLNRNPLTPRTQIAAAILLLCLATSVAGLRAQHFSTFSGTLVDQTNAVLPNVAVTLTNAAAQTRNEARTDSNGHFELVGLRDGDYQLAIAEAGFANLYEPIAIAGHDVTRTIQLRIGDLHETISITSGGPAFKPDLELRAKAREWAEQRMQKVAERCGGNGAAAAASGVGGNILAPSKIADVKPRYPENLQAAKVGGVVLLEVLIGTDGTVRDVQVSSGDPDLASAAVDAVRQWEFSPTLLNCTPVEVRMGVTANFVATP